MQWGSENNKHNLQTGDQADVSKPRTTYRFQYAKTKTFSTLLLGLPSVKSLDSFKVSLLPPKKTAMCTKKCKRLLHNTFSTTPYIPVFCTVIFLLPVHFELTLELVLFLVLLVIHIIRVCFTNRSALFSL